MSDTLKYIILIFITMFLAAGVYIFQPISAGVEAFKKTAPCSQPLRYSIGTIDPRFSISQPELEEAVHIAVNTWNSGTERPLLSKSDGSPRSGDIVIRLVYDDRQERTDREIRFRERIRSQQIRLDRRQLLHHEKRETFEERSLQYKKLAERTSDSLGNLNAWVEEKNDNGGFAGTDLEELERRKEEVTNAQEQIRRKQQELDLLARAINREMDELNGKFDEHNDLIKRYNEEFAGDLRFAKATYQKINDGGVVTVNQFMNKKELTLILAHELGHALGLDHLQLPESIMHSQMGAQKLNPGIQLTPEDIDAVRLLCH
ncbi:matrixin family metalloprotease [Rhodohalobacter sp. 8-1]|uniref:matrixin family metalloprotease n=1 Tax=Rhodohalobacter sp. 8-1 TaxID=3131972 RepID=UPI0030EEBCD4